MGRLTKYKAFNMLLEGGPAVLNMNFNTVGELRSWLDKKRRECGSPEEYDAWLHGFFKKGNTVSVRGEEYDYWACWKLL